MALTACTAHSTCIVLIVCTAIIAHTATIMATVRLDTSQTTGIQDLL